MEMKECQRQCEPPANKLLDEADKSCEQAKQIEELAYLLGHLEWWCRTFVISGSQNDAKAARDYLVKLREKRIIKYY